MRKRFGFTSVFAALLMTAEAGATPPAAPPSDVPPAVDVHIVSTVPLATLFAVDPAGVPFSCLPPCDRPVKIGAPLHFGGEGVRPSRPFQFVAPGSALVEVTTASRLGYVLSIVDLSVGGAALAIGASLAIYGAIGTPGTDAFGNPITQSSSDLVTAGLITGGVGLGLVIVGAVSLAMAKTRFRVADHPELVLDARRSESSVGFRF